MREWHIPGVLSAAPCCAGVGTQRLGKSTILNMFHSRKCSGFGLGHSLDAQTTGLWIWLRRHPKDPSIVVALMDTEGLALRPSPVISALPRPIPSCPCISRS